MQPQPETVGLHSESERAEAGSWIRSAQAPEPDDARCGIFRSTKKRPRQRRYLPARAL